MRYLSIDRGGKRTGLATGDDFTGQAGPVGAIHASDEDELLRQLLKAIDEYGPDELVLGVPYNMDGSEGKPAKSAMAFAERLEASSGLRVNCVDERLTSFDADEQMKQSGMTHRQKKDRRDALAATAILRDFLAD